MPEYSSPPPIPPNPPRPSGWKNWAHRISPDLIAWSLAIVNDPKTYPMHTEVRGEFDGVPALGRVEWHNWTHRGGKLVYGKFRGCTVYEPVGAPTAAISPSGGIELAAVAAALLFL